MSWWACRAAGCLSHWSINRFCIISSARGSQTRRKLRQQKMDTRPFFFGFSCSSQWRFCSTNQSNSLASSQMFRGTKRLILVNFVKMPPAETYFFFKFPWVYSLFVACSHIKFSLIHPLYYHYSLRSPRPQISLSLCLLLNVFSLGALTPTWLLIWIFCSN